MTFSDLQMSDDDVGYNLYAFEKRYQKTFHSFSTK